MCIERMNRWGKKTIYVWKMQERKPRIDPSKGYPTVSVSTGRVRQPSYVHRLVALAFVPGFKPGMHVNHINGIKSDNRAENLEWVENEDNVRHAWRNGLTGRRGEQNPSSVLTWRRVEAIRRALSLGVNVNTISIIAGVAIDTIRRIKSGVAWRDAQG